MIELKLFLIFLLGGFIVAIGWGLINFIKIIFKQNKIVKHLVEGVYACSFIFLFFVLLINYNYGVFRFYLTFAFVLGIAIERRTIGILFAKIFDWLYNKLCKMLKNIKQTKFIKRVFK